MTIDSDIDAVADKEEGAVICILGNERRIDHAWENITESIRGFAKQLWHSEGWTPRNEALMETVVK